MILTANTIPYYLISKIRNQVNVLPFNISVQHSIESPSQSSLVREADEELSDRKRGSQGYGYVFADDTVR